MGSAVFSGGCGTPGIWGFRKGAKPDFCLLEFSYYYKHPRIQKAKYGPEWVVEFSREGYKVRNICGQKLISSKEIIVFCDLT